MSQAALTFRDLTLGYGSHPAVHHLNGTVRKGSLTAVVGANGSGKSTLMKGIVGALRPMAGAVVKMPGTRIAYLPQQSELDRSFPHASSTWSPLGFGRAADCSAGTPPKIARP